MKHGQCARCVELAAEVVALRHAQGAPDHDKIALDAARSIMGLSRSLSPVQHKARIQCIVLDALSAVTSTERQPSGVMQAAEKASKRVAEWSDAKKDYAGRITSTECGEK